MLQHIPREELLVHFNNTLNEFPETRRYVIWVVKEYYKIAKLIESRPRFKPWDIWRIFGFPRQSRLRRYTPVCCVMLKEIPAKLVIERYSITVDVTGIQAVESRSRFFSLADWGLIRRTKYIGSEITLKRSLIRVAPVGIWTEDEIWEYIRRNKLPVNPVYEKYNIKRTGCVACTNFIGWEKAMASYSPRLYEYVKAKMSEWGIQEKRVRHRELREKIEKELGTSKLEDLYELIEY
jgi:3'-phosphoadenosine 5'-phosphosulfate sulfotransferase (PAPS reductase)/FAD synthetase